MHTRSYFLFPLLSNLTLFPLLFNLTLLLLLGKQLLPCLKIAHLQIHTLQLLSILYYFRIPVSRLLGERVAEGLFPGGCMGLGGIVDCAFIIVDKACTTWVEA